MRGRRRRRAHRDGRAGSEARHLGVKSRGGQRQRLSVACALVGRPDLLFLDEPTTGLDPQSRRQLWAVLDRFRAAGGSVLLTTHYMDEAHAICDRVGIMDHGELIALGTPEALVAWPRRRARRRLLRGRSARACPTTRASPRCQASAACATKTARWRWQPQRCIVSCRRCSTIAQARARVVSLTTHSATLEDVFVTLTGRHLRE